MALPCPDENNPADVPTDIDKLRKQIDVLAAIFGQGTTAARPAAGVLGRVYFSADEQRLYYDDGAAWRLSTSAAERGTALPPSPVDGQEYDYTADAANGVVWRLRYRAAATTHKWEFVGGADLTAVYGEAQPLGFPVVNTWYGLVKSPVVTLPLAGDYIYTVGADYMQIEKAVSVALYISVCVGPSGVVTTPLGPGCTLIAPGGGSSPAQAKARLNGRAAGDALRVAMAGGSTAAATFAVGTLTLAARPVRVG